MSEIELMLKKRNIILQIDPNNSIHKLTWTDIKQLCFNYKVQFRNQSFTVLISEIKGMFLNIKRAKFSKKQRDDIFEYNKGRSNMCKVSLDINDFHIDHVKPLAEGGSNDISNLQILCRECHYQKTKEENENGYIRMSDTTSSFNLQTKQIFDSVLAKNCNFIRF